MEVPSLKEGKPLTTQVVRGGITKYAFVIKEGVDTMIEIYDRKIPVSNGIEQDPFRGTLRRRRCEKGGRGDPT